MAQNNHRYVNVYVNLYIEVEIKWDVHIYIFSETVVKSRLLWHERSEQLRWRGFRCLRKIKKRTFHFISTHFEGWETRFGHEAFTRLKWCTNKFQTTFVKRADFGLATMMENETDTKSKAVPWREHIRRMTFLIVEKLNDENLILNCLDASDLL